MASLPRVWLLNVIMLILEFFGMRVFVKLLKIPKHFLLPVILVLCVVGSYAVNSNPFDAQSILFFGLLGYAMNKGKVPGALSASMEVVL